LHRLLGDQVQKRGFKKIPQDDIRIVARAQIAERVECELGTAGPTRIETVKHDPTRPESKGQPDGLISMVDVLARSHYGNYDLSAKKKY
jgi:hypothetical protein